eukprot:TRINITY_DN5159_c1_g1_i1.p1 TRINITY_DN5159_c1_g1~~TRINITY_DN5159_c1_g1_i1.p1  ORF type:complete len:972 (-),score=94.15 TRINITY_DN5159_c1_g1_i1:17-2932(-)
MSYSWQVLVTAVLIAVCWTASTFTLKQLQSECGYSKPYLITYMHEIALGVGCALLLICVRQPRGTSFLTQAQNLAPSAFILGLIAFVANCSFTVSLKFTQASSTLTIEQLTSVLIAGLSYLFLHERYGIWQLLALSIAVAGAISTVMSDAHTHSANAPDPLLGDAMAVVTCVGAAIYMILFKKFFAGGPDGEDSTFGWQQLLMFFTLKATGVAFVGAVGFLFQPNALEFPRDVRGWVLFTANMVLQVVFNLALNWGILVVSPLAARLCILLGLPLSLVVDLFQGSSITPLHAVGTSLVILGVVGFEVASTRESPRRPLDGDNADFTPIPVDVGFNGFTLQRCRCGKRVSRRGVLLISAIVLLCFASALAVLCWPWRYPHRVTSDCRTTYGVADAQNSEWPLPDASPDVQKLFSQGMLLCAGFNHDEALRSFRHALALAPQEPLLHWAEAYALSGNLNRPLTDHARLSKAKAAVARMSEAAIAPLPGRRRRLSAEETALVRAAEARFPAARTLPKDHVSWVTRFDVAYFEVLNRSMSTMPQTPSGMSWALLGQAAMETEPWAYWEETGIGNRQLSPVSKTAAAAFRAALSLNPRHPLALHYLIHLSESSRSSAMTEALMAATRLDARFGAGVGVGHLAHMPSHIYFRVGRYNDASEANMRAILGDIDYMRTCSAAGVDQYNTYYEMLYFCHNHAFLIASLEMEGRYNATLAAVDRLESRCHVDSVGEQLDGVFATYGHQAERYLAWLRFGKWEKILEHADGVKATTTREGASPVSEAVKHMVRASALASVHTPQVLVGVSGTQKLRCAEAEEERTAFLNSMRHAKSEIIFQVTRLNATVVSVNGADVLRVANFSLAARLAGACGNTSFEDDELPLLRSAAAAFTELPYFEPPFWRLDPRLCLGERLRVSGYIELAREAFSAHLETYPESGWGLYGLWKVAQASSNSTATKESEHRFLDAWRHADFELTAACF